MTRENYIVALEFCSSFNIELNFLESLNEYGLIQLENIEETIYIPGNQLSDLERMVRLHYDLNINIEGIETIINLLHKTDELRNEIENLRNRLGFYEDIT
jgi:CRISPR/Cas system-associated protein Cas10 (large subunit of type III CRISPR-Cas system)